MKKKENFFFLLWFAKKHNHYKCVSKLLLCIFIPAKYGDA